MKHHGEQFSGINIPRSTNYGRGKFGRLFPSLPPLSIDEADLIELSKNMVREADTRDGIPAGYTYLGQFITHDISFDPTTLSERGIDPEYLWNFRTPALDLDSVYGGGPTQCPYLYTLDKNGDRTLFLVNKITENKSIDGDYHKTFYDLPRISVLQSQNAKEAKANSGLYNDNNISENIALIVDPRNDEHLIISQLHTAFLLFHNKVVKKLIDDSEESIEHLQNDDKTLNGILEENHKKIKENQSLIANEHSQIKTSLIPENEGQKNIKAWEKDIKKWTRANKKIKEVLNCRGEALFNMARKIVTWHYQYIILHDYLPKLINHALFENGFLNTLIENKNNRQFYDWRHEPFIPLEFSAAAFRLGHSQVLRRYILNTYQGGDKSRNGELFGNTGNNINMQGQKKPDSGIEWQHFFFKEEEENKENNTINKNNKISPHITMPLKGLPFVKEKSPNMPNLAFRNLKRGLSLELPSGESVANAMGLPDEYQEAIQKYIDEKKQIGKESSLYENTPLWYYILAEAAAVGDGKLGRLGGTIVAEVLVGLIQGDKNSFFNQNPKWTPKEEDILDFEGGINTMIDFMRFAGVYTS